MIAISVEGDDRVLIKNRGTGEQYLFTGTLRPYSVPIYNTIAWSDPKNTNPLFI